MAGKTSNNENQNLGLDEVVGSGQQDKWIFIDESDIVTSPAQSLRPLVPDPNLPINVPFPPEINPVTLIRRNKNGDLLSRATNKFLIYRNEYAKELQACGFKLSMREVSRMAAQSWKKEPQHVKRKYEDIAREVEKLHVQLSMSSSPGWDRRRECFNQNPSEYPRLHHHQHDHYPTLPSVTVPSAHHPATSYSPYHYTATNTAVSHTTTATVPSQNLYTSIQPMDCRQPFYLWGLNCGNPQMGYIQYELYNESNPLSDLSNPMSSNFEINFGSPDIDSINNSPESYNCELPTVWY